MTNIQWIRINFIIVSMGVFLIASFNYVVDRYALNNMISIEGINTNKISNTNITTRFQISTLSNGGYDTLLLGSSRIGVMDPNVVDSYLGGKSFSLAQPRSVTSIHYDLFHYALEFNQIKNVIYGIDFLSFNKNNMVNTEYISKEQKIKNKHREYNFDVYFSFDSFIKNITFIKHNLFGQQVSKKLEPAIYDVQNGMRKHVVYIDALKNGTLDLDREIHEHLRQYFSEAKNNIYYNYTFSSEYLQYFKKIIRYCQDHNIRLWVYMPPMLGEHFDAIYAAGYFDEYEHYEREIAKITDYMDFTGNNTISMNKNNYWDSSHLREEFTPIVMARIFHDVSISVPDDFGVWVTKENVDAHLDTLKRQVRPYDIGPLLHK